MMDPELKSNPAPLTAERAKELLIYDPETGRFAWRVRRSGCRRGREPGYVGSHGYRQVRVDGTDCQAHRLAWLYVHGEWPPEQIDHIDGDPLNNRLANLRLAKPQENLWNTRRARNNTSGAKGISRLHGKWQARIQANGKRISLGFFSRLEDAIAARRAAAALLHGEFAREDIR